jgi:ribonuclease P protein component
LSAGAGADKQKLDRDDAGRVLLAPQRDEPPSRRIARGAHVLRRRSEFEAVLRSGRRMVSDHFVLRASPNDIAYARLGIIAGRKAAARAVDRNRAKRLIRDAFRAASGDIGPYDVTIQLRADVRKQLNSTLRDELEKLMASLVRRIDRGSQRKPGQ